MTEFEFTFRINQRLEDEAEMDSIYARSADSSLLVEGETTLLHFHRPAASLEAAIQSGIADVNAVGYHVAHVEIQPEVVAGQTA